MEWKRSTNFVSYPEALEFMDTYVESIKTGTPNLGWFLEHPPLFTKGLQSKPEDHFSSELPMFPTNRGGQITYHGPGQRVVYVMMNLKPYACDIKKYVFFLEEWIIETLSQLGISGERRAGRIGVWVVTPDGEKKIAALGVHLHQWITSHGISLNVSNDLKPYDSIVPCGLKDFGVTSLKEQGILVSMDEVDALLKETFSRVFGRIYG
ncbi:MAG: lipoyl(octanoyl) transferase LipB [Alphaproteobacteria bacterium]